jgi:hypothetical protein
MPWWGSACGIAFAAAQSGRFLDEWRSLLVPWHIVVTKADELYVCGSSPMRWPRLPIPGLIVGIPPKDQLVMVFDPDRPVPARAFSPVRVDRGAATASGTTGLNRQRPVQPAVQNGHAQLPDPRHGCRPTLCDPGRLRGHSPVRPSRDDKTAIELFLIGSRLLHRSHPSLTGVS